MQSLPRYRLGARRQIKVAMNTLVSIILIFQKQFFKEKSEEEDIAPESVVTPEMESEQL